MSISLLRRLLMKEAVKDTAGSSGIMSINKNIAAKVEQQVQRYVNDAMRQGVDLDTLSPEQLKMIVQMNKPKPPRVIAGDSPEGRGITEALLGKRGEVVNFPQKRSFKQEVDDMIKDGTITKGARGMKKSKKVQDREMFQDANKRLKTDVNKIIADIKAMDPMDSMKEANSVIGRKGVYKNLTPEESKKILKDTEDHIFERDIPIDPEDMATGGRAGFKGGGLTESDYLKVKDMLNHWHDYKKGGGTLSKTKFANAFFRENNADGGVAGLLGERPGYRSAGFISGRTKSSKSNSSTNQGPAGGASAGGNYGGNVNPNQTYGGGSGYTNTGGGGGGGGPPGTNTGGGTTTTTTNVPSNFREILRQRQILKNLGLIDEEDLALPGAGKVGKYILKKAPDYFDDKGLNYFKDFNFLGNQLKLKGAIDYKDMPKLFKGKPKGTLGLEGTTKKGTTYGFDMDKDKNINFGIKIPLGKRPKVAPRNFKDKFAPDISEFNFGDMTGIPSQAPTNMQLAMITDTQKDIIDKQGKMGQLTGAFDPNATFNAAKMFDDKGSSGVFGIGAREAEPMTREEFDAYINEKGYADGGPARQNFKMGKRAFLKAMFSAGAGIAGLKSGLFGIGGKEATKKAVTETVKQSAGSGTPPPYFFKLVEKIKTMGDDVTEKAATKDREVVTRYKDFELTEDVATGEKTIQRIKTDTDVQYYDETLAEDVYMNYKPGKGQADETTKGIPADEYVEDTSYLRTSGPQKGDIYDTVDGVPDDVIKEGTMFEDNMTEFGKTKKASGGIARMLGE